MDKHITDADLSHSGVALPTPLGLPGESEAPVVADPIREASTNLPQQHRERLGSSSQHGEPGAIKPSASDDSERLRRARRQALLAGVALVAVFGAVASGLYVFRGDLRSGQASQLFPKSLHLASAVSQVTHGVPENAPPPFEAGASSPAAGASPSPVVVPFAAQAPDHAALQARDFALFQTAGKGASPAANEAGAVSHVATQEAGGPLPADQAVGLAAPAATNTNKPFGSPPAVTPPVPAANQEAGLALPPISTVASSAFNAGDAAAPATLSAAPPSTPPSEPATTAAKAHADPTPAQQAEAVGMVKALGAQLRDTRAEVAQLRQAVTQLSGLVETKTSDFENRLSLAEAENMVQQSARAGTTAADAAVTTPVNPVRVPAARGSAPPLVALAVAPERRNVKDYVVKGASPGLAVLASLNPVAGTESVIEVGVGDAVPGVGKIKRVYQRGTTWIVETDNGSIQQ